MHSFGPHTLTTFSGRQLDLDACTSADIVVEDIAAALSKVCRFGAQCRVFYSVAQHAVLVHDILVQDLGRSDLELYGLHHDSHEAFVGDLPSLLKDKLNSEGNDADERLCGHLDAAISEAFGFSIPPDGSANYAAFKRADNAALSIEAHALLPDSGADVQKQLIAKGVVIADICSNRILGEPLAWADAEVSFLAAHTAAVAAHTPA